MPIHRIVSLHFLRLFEEISEPQLDLGLDPVLRENFSSLTCLVTDTVSSEPTCACMSNGGTLTPALELQLKEPISVSPTEGIPRIQDTESRTPTPLEQHSIGKIVDLMPKEEESNRTSEVIPPEYSLSALRQTPLYRYNQKPLRMIVRQEAIITERAFAPMVAEFDGLFDNAIPAQPEDFVFKIHGSPEFQAKVKALNKKYDVFSTSVRSEPADVTPMEVKVDLEAWRRPANAGPPRKQSLLKEKAILGQITPLLDSKVIQPSMQPFYSQVHMVPKVTSPTEPGDFRFCVDLRGLNNCTENTAWPLPNIPALLTRIGQQKPKLFAKLDLTSGYHQFPLHENSWKYFAFVCFLGIYEWLRCVMGGKGVGAHFQRTMAMEVLVGLIYIILELYLDDIIVFADSEDQFLERLETVYVRLKSKRITLNPKKCEFGLSEVEFVGHTINDTGISFSKEKLHGVVTFRHMTTQKELRSFLGLGNYFRDHVLNYSIQSLSPTTSYFLDTTAVSRIESCQRCYQRVSSIIFCG